MKRLHIRLLLASLILMVASSLAAEAKPAALVVFVAGKASVNRAGKAATIKVNDLLQPGDSITTEDKSSVNLQFSNGLILQVGAKSVFQIQSIDHQKNQTNVDVALQNGSTGVKAGKDPGRSLNLHVTTPTSVAGVRGTEFIVESNQSSSQVLVKEGSVVVKDPKTLAEENLAAGQKIVADGKALQKKMMDDFDKKKFEMIENMEKFRKGNFEAVVEQIRRNQEMLDKQKQGP